MGNSKTLLRMPELVKAVEPLVPGSITHDDIFRLIGTGDIKPLGYIQRVPVFDLSQIGTIAKKLQPQKPTLLTGALE